MQYFEKDYLTIANLECNLSDKYYDSIEQFVFLAPADYANILTAGSVEFVTLANNHTMDFGQSAYDDTAARSTPWASPTRARTRRISTKRTAA